VEPSVGLYVRRKISLRSIASPERTGDFGSSHLRSGLKIDLQKQGTFGLAGSSPKLRYCAKARRRISRDIRD
jgi:hypothetical protein